MLEVRDDNAAAFEELGAPLPGPAADRVCGTWWAAASRPKTWRRRCFCGCTGPGKSYQPEAKFSTWLYTIANHVAANALRTRSRRPEVTLPSRDSGPMGARPLDKMLHGQQRADARPAIGQGRNARNRADGLGIAGARQRMAVLLSKFEGMSYAEIAAVMEIVAPGDQVVALAGAGEPPRSAATLLRSRRSAPRNGDPRR